MTGPMAFNRKLALDVERQATSRLCIQPLSILKSLDVMGHSRECAAVKSRMVRHVLTIPTLSGGSIPGDLSLRHSGQQCPAGSLVPLPGRAQEPLFLESDHQRDRVGRAHS